MKIRGYTEEQVQFLQENRTLPRRELTEKFNKKFNTNKTVLGLKSVCNNHGLYTGRTGYFTSETSPRWAKGLNKSEFKSHYSKESYASLVSNIQEKRKYHIGDTIIRHNIPYIVVSEEANKPWDDRVRVKARYVYEQQYGEIQNDDMVLHIDGDEMNCEIDNLVLLSQRYKPFFRWYHWWDLTGSALLAAIKFCELNELLKEDRNDNRRT